MPEILEKLRPDRDLQCYFERPSAVAAMSAASASGFTLSGCWRQQFDWVVVEWNRDNVFEHPALRNLPDGNLSGLHLSYEETRANCMPLDASWYATVDWPYLRVWTEESGGPGFYQVPLKNYATAAAGSFSAATAVFELQGTPTPGDYVELAWGGEHHTYQLAQGDILETAAQAIVDSINGFSPVMDATRDGARITLSYAAAAGANGNRIGVYGNVAGAQTECWNPGWQLLSGGQSPAAWRVDLDFANLQDKNGAAVPMESARKLRWTWAADMQPAAYSRSEFEVVVSNWTVTGTNRGYLVAGPGSRRIEDLAPELIYAGAWVEARGNFSGGSIRQTTTPGASVSCAYQAAQAHRLYLGTRRAPGCAQASVVVDGGAPLAVDLELDGEDVLARIPLGELAGQITHTVTVAHAGAAGSSLYFDFLEIALPAAELPVFPSDDRMTLATDWDTDHSMALAPERTAWLVRTLGFTGRANHYVGALWFYELARPGHQYASATVEFSGTPEFSTTTELFLDSTRIAHMVLIGDTPASIAKALELEINAASTAVRAAAANALLTLHARAMGAAGNAITLAVDTHSGMQAQVSGPALSGGADGDWRTDLNASPRINKAARDWTRRYFQALAGYGITVAAAFSMELQHGDPGVEAGIAQRYPDGSPVLLNTPALQTNFSPAGTAFWQQAYRDLADLQAQAGQPVFLQFGEVQWWYFPKTGVGMPYYDAHTTSAFAAAYGRALHVFLSDQDDPAAHPEDAAFLADRVGAFSDAVMVFVRQAHPAAQFEVLYAPDVNEGNLNQIVNLPAAWSPAALECFKTENFTYTGSRDLDKARGSLALAAQRGFSREHSAHLVGIGDHTAPWAKESRLAKGLGFASVVLFALDQFCLIGYRLPLGRGMRRSAFFGA
jgi:hypothetical protein